MVWSRFARVLTAPLALSMAIAGLAGPGSASAGEDAPRPATKAPRSARSAAPPATDDLRVAAEPVVKAATTAIRSTLATHSYPAGPLTPPGSVDGSTATTTFTVPPGDFADGSAVGDVVLELSFSKTGGSTCPGPSGTDDWAEEVRLRLTSPGGTTVTLVGYNDYQNSNPDVGPVTVTFTDAAASTVVGLPIQTGSFRPAGGAMADFSGEPLGAGGAWVLELSDSAAPHPLCFLGATLSLDSLDPTDLRITRVADAPVAPAGEDFTYTLFVDNLGPNTAYSVSLRDDILSGDDFTLVGWNDDPDRDDSCTQERSTRHTLLCTLNEPLEVMGAGGGTGRWVIQAIVHANEDQTLTATADVFRTDGVADLDPSNNQTSVVTPVEATADLGLSTDGTSGPVAVAVVGEQQVQNQAGSFAAGGEPFPETPAYTASSTKVAAGRRIEYTTWVTNAGPSTAEGVVFEQRLPAGATVEAGTLEVGQGSCDPGVPGDPAQPLTCSIGNMNPGAGTRVRLRVLVGPGVDPGSVLTTGASVDATTFDPDIADNTASGEVTVETWADTTLTKLSVGENITGWDAALGRAILEDLPGQVSAGRQLRYEITVQNAGPSDARNVQILDLLPGQSDTGLDHDPVVLLSADGVECSPMDEQQEIGVFGPGGGKFGQVVWCHLGDLPAGARRTFSLYTHVDEAVPDGLTLTNGAFTWWGAASPPADPADFTPFPFPQIPPELPTTDDPALDDNFADTNTGVNAVADLALSKVAGKDQAAEGEDVPFWLEVGNTGPSAARGVVLTDSVPEGLSFVDAAADPPASCNEVGGVVTCAIGDLAVGTTRAVQLLTSVDQHVPPDTVIDNIADVAAGTTDFHTQDNTAAASVLVNADGIDPITEVFAGDVDLAYTQLRLVPDGSPAFYSHCSSPTAELPIDPDGGIESSVPTDDGFVAVPLTDGKKIRLYGVKYDVVYIGSNGYVTFGAGDSAYDPTLANHFALPRVAPLFADLDPSLGGKITWQQLADSFVVTWQAVPGALDPDPSTAQVQLFFDGRILITWGDIGQDAMLAGLSAGEGTPVPFLESDLTGSVCALIFEDGFESGDTSRWSGP